jgi:hypothetical protein
MVTDDRARRCLRESDVSTAPPQVCKFASLLAGRTREALMVGRAAPHRAPLGLAGSSCSGPVSPGLGNFPMSTTSNFPLPPPVPRSPSRSPTALRCAARPVRLSGCSACTRLSGSCAPVSSPNSKAPPPPRRRRRFQGRNLVTRSPTSLHVHSLLRPAAAAVTQSTLFTALPSHRVPLRRPCGYALRARPL